MGGGGTTSGSFFGGGGATGEVATETGVPKDATGGGAYPKPAVGGATRGATGPTLTVAGGGGAVANPAPGRGPMVVVGGRTTPGVGRPSVGAGVGNGIGVGVGG